MKNTNNTAAKKPIRKDLLLIGILLLAGAVLALVLFLTKKEGAYVEVRVTGQEIKTYPLNKDTVVEIEGADGGHNVMTISDGQAWMSDADCPDKLCMGMGKIDADGEAVVCLPHEIVLTVVDEANKSDVDITIGGQIQ